MLGFKKKNDDSCGPDLLQTMFEQTRDGVIVTDAHGKIVLANQAAARITGYSREELVGRESPLFKSDRHDESFYQTMWESVRTTGAWNGHMWSRRKDGQSYLQWLSISVLREPNGDIGNYVATFSRITDQTGAPGRLQRLRQYDALTDLPNRFLFQDRLEHALAGARRNDQCVVVMFMDVDDFKLINESMGHGVGDDVLKETAGRLMRNIRKNETLARLGGDEFAVILAEIPDSGRAIQSATIAAQRILQALGEPLNAGGTQLFLSASVGITVFPFDGRDGADLIKNAEAAMYHAKERGKGLYEFYTAQMNAKARERITLVNKLHTSLGQGEFALHFQPQIGLHRGEVTGLEALLRWNSPDLGMVPPNRFIPLLEESRLILPVGRWVLTESLRQLREWQQAGIAPHHVSVNLSARQFEEPNLARLVDDAISAAEIDPRGLELEITEGTIMVQSDRTIRTLNELKEIGVAISVDDFGTGYSSIGYLKRFPLDRLKIDRTFVKDIPGDTDDVAITTAVIALAHSLKLGVVAEGVETDEQISFLRTQSCEEVQGFFYSKPLPPDQCSEFLRKNLRGRDNQTGTDS